MYYQCELFTYFCLHSGLFQASDFMLSSDCIVLNYTNLSLFLYLILGFFPVTNHLSVKIAMHSFHNRDVYFHLFPQEMLKCKPNQNIADNASGGRQMGQSAHQNRRRRSRDPQQNCSPQSCRHNVDPSFTSSTTETTESSMSYTYSTGHEAFGYQDIPVSSFTSDPDAVKPPTYEDCVNRANPLYAYRYQSVVHHNLAFNLTDDDVNFSPPPPYSETHEGDLVNCLQIGPQRQHQEHLQQRCQSSPIGAVPNNHSDPEMMFEHAGSPIPTTDEANRIRNNSLQERQACIELENTATDVSQSNKKSTDQEIGANNRDSANKIEDEGQDRDFCCSNSSVHVACGDTKTESVEKGGNDFASPVQHMLCNNASTEEIRTPMTLSKYQDCNSPVNEKDNLGSGTVNKHNNTSGQTQQDGTSNQVTLISSVHAIPEKEADAIATAAITANADNTTVTTATHDQQSMSQLQLQSPKNKVDRNHQTIGMIDRAGFKMSKSMTDSPTNCIYSNNSHVTPVEGSAAFGEDYMTQTQTDMPDMGAANSSIDGAIPIKNCEDSLAKLESSASLDESENVDEKNREVEDDSKKKQ